MRRSIARTALALAALLSAAASEGCMGADLGAMGNGTSDADTDTDDPAPDPPDWNGDVAASQDSDPCELEEPAQFVVAPPSGDGSVSPVLARMLLQSGRAPNGGIRVHEFVGYYQADVPEAADAQIHVSGAVTDRGDGALGLEVVVAAGTSFADRSLNLVLAIDTSETMEGVRIARVRQCCVALAGALRAGDAIAIALLDPDAEVLLAPYLVEGPSDPGLIAHCNAIGITGGIDLSFGLNTAYALVDESRDGVGLNRIILFTGGSLAPTVDDAAIAAEAAAGGSFDQIVLAGVGIGDPAAASPYDRAALDVLTAAGAGAHVLVDSAEEAAAAFGDRPAVLADAAAIDPEVEVVLPPTLAIETLDGVPVEALAGAAVAVRLERGRAIATHHVVRSCDAAHLDPAAIVRITASAADPSTGETVEGVMEAPLSDLLDASAAGPSKRDAVVAYALSLAAGSSDPPTAQKAAEDARALVAAAAAAHPEDPDLAEIGDLLDAYLALL